MASMDAANPNFVTEQRMLYDALRVEAVSRKEAVTTEAQLHAMKDENNASCALYAPLTNYRVGQFKYDSTRSLVSIVDLMFTGNEQGTNSSEPFH
ncbi:hypothetical protein D1007_39137 [Hordeum vulgare]|nr:hypothetical protein D1007_39137 [Hordeum vulgare]